MAQVFNVRSAISIHALREEGDITAQEVLQCANYFYPRPPRGGRRTIVLPSSRSTYFYPRPPRGGRRFGGDFEPRTGRFLSTPSARRATPHLVKQAVRGGDFYPRPPRGGRLIEAGHAAGHFKISIHALREEGDARPGPSTARHRNFYPRPPRGGRRSSMMSERYLFLFLSTPSARRATVLARLSGRGWFISIHALREEGDRPPLPAWPRRWNFYPRPPRGGRRCLQRS